MLVVSDLPPDFVYGLTTKMTEGQSDVILIECHLMLKFPVGPNRNASFPDTPFLYDHIHIWSCMVLFSPCLPPHFTMLPCK